MHRAALSHESYLNIPALLAACEITGADAVHPGYGFLSENARFAEILEEHEIRFIGPTSEHIRLMGDKIQAKETAKSLGIPVVPGSEGAVTTDEQAYKIAREIGYPVLVKAAAGGGGRGMKVAHSEDRLSVALSTARSESKAAFGDSAVYIEKYLPSRAISKSRCSATGAATRSISASATVRFSAATRRSGKKRPRPRSTTNSAARSAKRCAQAMRA